MYIFAKLLTIMKKILPIIVIMTAFFASCTTKFDIYSDDGDTTIIYGILDTEADTTFFKITKSFLGNAVELAQNYDANNYKYNEIDVRLIGVFGNATHTDTIRLDTISKMLPSNGNTMFYSGRRQLYYFTDRKLQKGHDYTIEVYRKSDGVTVSAKARTTNTAQFLKPSHHQTINMRARLDSVIWWVNDEGTNYHTTSAYFDIHAVFHYKELMPGSTDTTHRSIDWRLDSGLPENLKTSFYYYQIYYTPNTFFDLLRNDEYLKNNSPFGVRRWVKKMEFRISSVGEELYCYYLVNTGNSIIQDVPNYTNVRNGMGLVSSRANDRSFHVLDQMTKSKISSDYDYGFIYNPND